MSDVQLKVNGQLFGGWQSVRIERGIEQIAGAFELTATDHWHTSTGLESIDIKPGMPCEVLVYGSTLITGYIDTVNRRYDKVSHEISISGRDKTADLVDCSAIFKTGQWSNKRIDQIANDLLKPFGIPVIVQADVGKPFTTFGLQIGESVFEAVERMARMRALLVVSDSLGNLLLTRAGSGRAPTDLVEGVNILHADGEFTWKERFSQYTVLGQSSGDDENYGAAVAQESGTSEDANITRYRPLIVLAEEQDGIASFGVRAEWERNVRAGRGARATITVQGWSANNVLWSPNTLVRLQSPLLSADFDMLIVLCNFGLDDGAGELTTLQLALPAAFETISGVQQTRLQKAIRKKQGTESGITQPEWNFPSD